jgi:hypothetical protein
VWAERYDGSVTDVFALQDKVTNAIMDALALRRTSMEQIAAVGRMAKRFAFLRNMPRSIRTNYICRRRRSSYLR